MHANLNFIFPFLIFHTNRTDQTFSVGISIGTLAERDYYDESNNLLSYNSTNLKAVKFGRYWEGSGMLDYEIGFRWTKRVGINLDFDTLLRYRFIPINWFMVFYKEQA